MSYYVHDLSPFAIRLWGDVGIRWYGLAYVAGFVCAFFLLRQFSKKGELDIPQDKIESFITGFAIFGVLLGGRIGYCLFYGLKYVMADPLYPLKLWEGGMSSHGGMIGVILYVFLYAKRNKISFWNIMDNLVCVVPLGLFFGRLANFINGELWGRVTTVPWAVIFPQSGDGLARHPSQIYEAFCEGLFLLFILFYLRRFFLNKKAGLLSALFLTLYGANRFFVEFFREPDSNIYFDWMSKGQLYSLAMIILGVIMGLSHLKPIKDKM